MADIGTLYILDTSAAEAALDRLAAKEKQFADAVKTSQAVNKQQFTDAAQAALTYQNRLSNAAAEVQQATAVHRELRAVVRDLVLQERELTQAQANTKEPAKLREIKSLLQQNQAEQKKVRAEISLNTAALEKEKAAEAAITAEIRKQEAAEKAAGAAASNRDSKGRFVKGASTPDVPTPAVGGVGNVLTGGAIIGGVTALAGAVTSLGEDIFETTAKYESFQAILSNALGSEAAAAEALQRIQDLAAKTPFSVEELTASYIKFVNRGIVPSQAELLKLGDVAASQGKSFDQLTEAVLDAGTGEFERLKEFGIQGSKTGNQIELSFKGVNKTVANTPAAIKDALVSFGELNGVAGTTAKVSQTLEGQLSNLKDQADQLENEVGQGLRPVFAFLLQTLVQLFGFIKQSGGPLREFANYFVELYNSSTAFRLGVNTLFVGLQNGVAVAKGSIGLLVNELVAAGKVVKGVFTLDFDLIKQGYNDAGKALKATLLNTGEQVGKNIQEGLDRTFNPKNKVALLGVNEKDVAAQGSALEKAATRINASQVAQVKVNQKALEKALREREAALKALRSEQEKLQETAAKIELDSLKDQGQARAAEQLRQDRLQIAQIEQSLKDREAAVRKAGGKGSSADGVIDGVQRQQVQVLTQAAEKRYADALFKINQEQYDRLLNLQEDSDAKSRELLERRYENERAAAQGQSDVLQALEAAKQAELLALEASAEQKRLEIRRNLETNNAQVRATVAGPGTGRSEREARQQERLELIAQDEKFYQDEIANSVRFEAEKGEAIRSEARKQLALLAQERKKAEQDAKGFDIYSLILGESDDEEGKGRKALDDTLGAVVDFYAQSLQAQQQATDARVGQADRNIADLQSQIAAEIQLNKAGSASNIAGLREQIAAEKAARRDALNDKRKIAREQVILDTLTQASSVAVAVANALAALPVPFNLVAAALLVTTFIATKAKAFAAAGKQPEGFYRGGYTGGNDKKEERGVVHGKEFVHTADVTEKYRYPLFEALHKNRPQDIDWSLPEMQKLLPDYALPKQLRAEQQAVIEQRLQVQADMQLGPLQAELRAVQKELAAIRQHVGTTANKIERVPLTDGRVLALDPVTNSTTITSYVN
ncbi:hypothetical protein [Hymenobacter sp. YC55]|uniref:hypothetical protein n=1 Tax=Hymenobacter sp. YC55 TaxID=3034019 RepID=UPI0023F9CD55|nr:hypothetical protein [Hymenobacter sp. YC55]MDF7810938.1 hypothetical protein [Hymenobacter sp. YC55]